MTKRSNSTETSTTPTRSADRRWTGTTTSWGSAPTASPRPRRSLPAGFSAATAGPDFTTEIRRGVEVAVTADDTTFTTNSKDILDISAEWRCVRANNVTDKGDLVNTYAVAYINAAGELILYFGAEKNDASGTNNLGVWFLQDATVNCAGGGTGPGNPFTGNHVVGDILLVSEFTGGGTTATITAYVWDPTNLLR